MNKVLVIIAALFNLAFVYYLMAAIVSIVATFAVCDLKPFYDMFVWWVKSDSILVIVGRGGCIAMSIILSISLAIAL